MSIPPAAWYALRRTLPPWSFEENLRELIDWLPAYRVDELIVKLDTEEFTHGQPPLWLVRQYVPRLHRIREEMEKLGIVYSLNPWITVGHGDRGRVGRMQIPDLQTMVGADGTACTCCACPLSAGWRRHLEEVWSLYASTRPHVVWIEDDIRTFNHRPIEQGCFCPVHLRRFARRIGREEVGRESLVAALLRTGQPHPWRAEWLAMQAEVMNETVGFIARVVHAVSPESHLGLMSSGARSHCCEGRDWTGLATALADGRSLYSRPPLANYCETSLRGLYHSLNSIKLTRHVLPAGTIEQTEVENVPFTQYSKSTRFTFLQMAISYACGCHGVTMNLFDHCGTPMEATPEFGRALAAEKEFLNALASAAPGEGEFRGVQLLHHDRAGYFMQTSSGASLPAALTEDSAPMMFGLEGHGIATTYAASSVVASCGQQLRAFSDSEIAGWLAGGLLLDATAAKVLCERGFADLIGVEEMAEPRFIRELGEYSAEELLAPEFGGQSKKFLTATLPGLADRVCFSRIKPFSEATIVSRLVDPDAVGKDVCMFAFTNRLGGRVVVHAWDYQNAVGPAFYHPFRAEQLRGAVRWLSRGCPELLVGGGAVAWPLGLRRDAGNTTVLAIFNLCLDPWPEVEVEFAETRIPSRIERLDSGGGWLVDDRLCLYRELPLTRLVYAGAVEFSRPLIIRLTWPLV